MQEIVAFHSPLHQTGGVRSEHKLRIVFANRTGRRKLIGVNTLVEECNNWRPPVKVKMSCIAHNFGGGFVNSLPVLAGADVIITPHGADIINAFALRRGSSVFEVMPVYRSGCPCSMYKKLFSSERGGPPAVLHYQIVSENKSMVESDLRRVGTYNMDIKVPWSVLVSALLEVLSVGGNTEKYKYRRFTY